MKEMDDASGYRLLINWYIKKGNLTKANEIFNNLGDLMYYSSCYFLENNLMKEAEEKQLLFFKKIIEKINCYYQLMQ